MSRALWTSIVLLAALPAVAAGPGCEPLDAAGFRDLSLLLRSGVDRGDDALVASILGEIDARVPCLSFPPEPHDWANVLALRAVAAYARQGDWQTPMAAALRIWPGADRAVASRHPLASWEPPEPPPPGPRVPERVRVYVDGLPAEHLPPPGALALVQRTDGAWWNSVVVTPDAPLSEGWANDRVVPPPHVGARATASLGAGGVVQFQTPDFETDWVQTVAIGERGGPAVGGAADLLVTFYSPLGVLLAGSGWLQDSPGLDLHAAGVWAPPHLVVGVGLGTSSVETLEGPTAGSRLERETGIDEVRRLYMLRYVAAVGRVTVGRATRWQLGLQGGGSANLVRLAGDLEVGLPRRGSGPRWVVGVGFASVAGRFEQPDAGEDHTLSAGSSRSWLRFGRAWGEDR